MTVTMYTFENVDGCEQTYTTFNAIEAQDTARRNGWRCIANEFEWADSEIAWDFTDRTDEPDPSEWDAVQCLTFLAEQTGKPNYAHRAADWPNEVARCARYEGVEPGEWEFCATGELQDACWDVLNSQESPNA